MANQEQLERLLASSREHNNCQAWNSWCGNGRWWRIDLTSADLSGADLRSAFLWGAHLEDASLMDADLGNAELKKAHLNGAYLDGAHLGRANLSYAVLTGARLVNTDLRWAKLVGADLTSAYLSGVHLARALLEDTDLSGVDLGDMDLAEAIFTGTVLEGTNLQACRMDGAWFDAPVRGAPIWPVITASAWDALQEEARSPTTPAERLKEMVIHWPGYLVRHLLVTNPNLPQKELLRLAPWLPAAFLSNPVLPLLFMEDPTWPPYAVAREILKAAQQEPDWPEVAAQYAALVAHLERRAADTSGPPWG